MVEAACFKNGQLIKKSHGFGNNYDKTPIIYPLVDVFLKMVAIKTIFVYDLLATPIIIQN